MLPQSNNTQSIFIIDSSSFLFRAYYSIRPLLTKDGASVHAVFGFCRMIKRLIDDYKLNHIVLVWDSKGKTKRHELYPQYKANRDAIPADYSYQKLLAEEFADLVGFAQISVPGVEADDIMFSLAKHFESKNQSSVIVTTDKDMGQILSNNITLLDPFKGEFITKELLESRLNFPIEKIPFFYSIAGDQSDNIPGIRGIGPKGALKLVSEFDNLNDLYANLNKVESMRLRSLLEKDKDNAYLSEKLFTLQRFTLNLTTEKCQVKKERWSEANEFFKRLEFYSLIDDSDQKTEIVKRNPNYEFKPIVDKTQLNNLIEEIKQKKLFSVDTEGTSLSPLKGKMVGLSICLEVGKAYYIPFGHTSDELQLSRKIVLGSLKAILEDSSIKKILHNAKFDALMFFNEGIHLKGIYFDTLIAADLLVPFGQRIGLKYLSKFYLNEPMMFFDDVVKKQGFKYFSQVPINVATEYAAADAHQTMMLYNKFKRMLNEEELDSLFYNIELPTLNVLVEMEKAGIFLDSSLLEKIQNQVLEEINCIKDKIITTLGADYANINLNSCNDVRNLLFKDLKLPSLKKTAYSKSDSTDKEVLKELAKYHTIPALISDYRELYKILSTYTRSLSKHINLKTGRVHTSFSQINVATGRLASSSPNLQNIPVDKCQIRSAFLPIQDYEFLSVDYSQIELRVLAYLTQDKNLMQAFDNNQDIHSVTASGLFNVPIYAITSEQRKIGKQINFSIIYGLTPHGLANDLNITLKEAKEYIDKFLAQYPAITPWMNAIIQQAEKKGYVTTLFGRKRYIPGIKEKNKILYEQACRVAINTVVQGTTAEIMKMGMATLYEKLVTINAKMLLQIHDELLIEVPKDKIGQARKVVETTMENIVYWNVPLKVVIRIGKNWQEVTK